MHIWYVYIPVLVVSEHIFTGDKGTMKHNNFSLKISDHFLLFKN